MNKYFKLKEILQSYKCDMCHGVGRYNRFYLCTRCSGTGKIVGNNKYFLTESVFMSKLLKVLE